MGAVLSLLAVETALAETPPLVLKAGDRVRLTGTRFKGLDPEDLFVTEVLGTLEGWDEETVRVRVRVRVHDLDRVVASRRGAIDALEVSVRPQRLLRSTAKGAAFGGVIGGGLGALSNGFCTSAYVCFDRGEAAILGAFEGVVVGTVVGLFRGMERWKKTPLPTGTAPSATEPRVAWALAPVRGGGLGLTVRIGLGDARGARVSR